MGTLLNRRRYMGGSDKGPININVRTHSTGSGDASLDVKTGGGVPVNILYTAVLNTPWTNGYIEVRYLGGWRTSAITPCLYDGQTYNSGDLIAAWNFTEILLK